MLWNALYVEFEANLHFTETSILNKSEGFAENKIFAISELCGTFPEFTNLSKCYLSGLTYPELEKTKKKVAKSALICIFFQFIEFFQQNNNSLRQ